MERRRSQRVDVGHIPVGDGAAVSVQSMTNTPTSDIEATAAQIESLVAAGCEIVRVAVPKTSDIEAFSVLAASSPAPLVADVHFDHRIAIGCAQGGAAKLRINPGNIGDLERVDAVIEAAGEAGIPIRIGVNAGSLDDRYRDLDWPLSQKLAASAVSFCDHFASRGFSQIIVSVKASSVLETIQAYRLVAEEVPYPLHLGVTEAGAGTPAVVKSSIGIGALLAEGIGDTLRVSLTGDPVDEIGVAWDILAAVDLRRRGPEVISCPTCGRCQVDLVAITTEVRRRLADMDVPLKVAVMGCSVNGPGEAREADVGVASGGGVGVIFRAGEPVRKVPEDQVVQALFEEIEDILP